MQPSPRDETPKPLFPSLRVSMVASLNRFSVSEVRIKRHRSGSPILPIYCLFLLLFEKSLAFPEQRGYLKARHKDGNSMKNLSKDLTPPQDRAQELLKELAREIAFFVGSRERLITDVPGLLLSRRTAPTAPASATYEPSLAVVAQGRKRADLGGTTFIFDESRYLLTSLDLPVICNVIEASEDVPYLCFVLKLEMPVVRELLSREEIQAPEATSGSPAMATGETTAELLDACCRLIDLLDTPQDISFLSGLIQREIVYRILRGRKGHVFERLQRSEIRATGRQRRSRGLGRTTRSH